MARVTGIGGIFLRADDPVGLTKWYAAHLGLPAAQPSGVTFRWGDGASAERPGSTTWALFPADTTYFGTSGQSAMVNFRVDDLDGVVRSLEADGVPVLPEREDNDFGRFAWCVDPEGNRIELWEPPPGM